MSRLEMSLLSLLLSTASVAQEEYHNVREDAEILGELLSSEDPALVGRGEALLAAEGEELLALYESEIALADGIHDLAATANVLAVVRGRYGEGSVWGFPRRARTPPTSPEDHPWAPRIRAVLLESLEKTGLADLVLTTCLATIADRASLDRILAILEGTGDGWRGESLLLALHRRFGDPDPYYIGCTAFRPAVDPTPVFLERKAEFLRWYESWRDRDPALRARDVIGRWEGSQDRGGSEWLAAMRELGVDAIGGLEELKASSSETLERGMYESALVALRPQVDQDLVRTLLTSQNPEAMKKGLLVVQITGSPSERDVVVSLARAWLMAPDMPTDLRRAAVDAAVAVDGKASLEYLAPHREDRDLHIASLVEELERWGK